MRTTTLILTALIVLTSAAVFADDIDEYEEDAPFDRFVNKNPPMDLGMYASIAPSFQLMDTGRLESKIFGTEPFDAYTPALNFELHFFGRRAAIFGFSGGYWESQAHSRHMDTTISGWDIKMDFGNPIAEMNENILSFLVGLGYVKGNVEFEGDFDSLDLSDSDLPDGNGVWGDQNKQATLTKEGFLYDLALRGDLRDGLGKDRRVGGLLVYGFSMGYRSALFTTPWRRSKNEVEGVQNFLEHMLYARLHLGFGFGARMSDADAD